MTEDRQDEPDAPEPEIVPPYMRIRIEADRRYPGNHWTGYHAFVAGAEWWEAECGRDTGNPG